MVDSVYNLVRTIYIQFDRYLINDVLGTKPGKIKDTKGNGRGIIKYIFIEKGRQIVLNHICQRLSGKIIDFPRNRNDDPMELILLPKSTKKLSRNWDGMNAATIKAEIIFPMRTAACL